MHRDHFKRSAVRLLVAIAAALALWPAAARADITAFSATAGTPFDGVVAVVHENCGSPCTGLNPFVTVDWGDGQQTNHVQSIVDCDPVTQQDPNCLGADFVVSVRDTPHTYARPGVYAVSFTGPLFVPPVSVDGIVGDDPHSISETVPALTPVVGAAVSGAVATFTDTNTLAQPSEFSATIDWGDGHTTTGTVTHPLGQPFQVSGSHVYAHVGSFPVTIAIQHLPLNGTVLGASATQSATATVSDAILTGAGNSVTAVAGVPFSATVASFSDPNPFATAADFRATVTWGGEGSSPGTVVAAPGGFAVTASHTFAGSGQIPVTVVVSSDGGSSATIGTVAAVSAAPPPPVTTVALAPAAPNGQHGWYRSAVHAAVSARPIVGTVTQTRCVLDGPVPASFDALVGGCRFLGPGAEVAGDGRHVLYAASITDAGQKEVPSATVIDIDATPPQLACPRQTPTFVQGSTGASVTATVRDATSGPVSRTVSAPAAVATAGRKRADLTGRDQAGNVASVRCPYRVLGHISPSMFWLFHPGASVTTVTSLIANDVPVAATVRLLCRGGGCSRVASTVRVSVRRTCRAGRCTSRRRAAATGTVDLTPLLRGRHLRPAAVLTVAVTARDTIGKAFVFTMRSGRNPNVVIGCLAPGSLVPGRGC